MSVKRSIPLLTTALVFLVTFGATAHAASAIEPTDGSLLDLLKPVLEAFKTGHYLFAGATCLVLAVALVRRYSPRYLPKFGAWLATDAGSASAALLASFGASLAATLADGASATWQMVWDSAKVAFIAMGGYAAIRTLIIKPYLAYLATKGPAWLHKPAELVLWVFGLEMPDRAPVDVTTVEPNIPKVK